MILLYGRLDDPPIARALELLQEARAEHVVLSQGVLDRERLTIDLGPRGVTGELVSAGQAIPLERIRSVYARPLELPRGTIAPDRISLARRLHEQFYEWLDVSAALVINRPRAMQSNFSKPLQAQLIGAAGFTVADTLVTSHPDEVRAFWREHTRVVFKSTSGIRSIVRELDEQAMQRLPLISDLPVQFQAYVPGTDVRVHVVGRRTFPVAITSPVTDYRYAAQEGAQALLEPVGLPEAITERCIALAREMELPLAGIDLRRRPDGEFVCFEVNPMPAYTYFEAQSGLPIGAALVELLMSGLNWDSEMRHGTGDRKPERDHREDRVATAAPSA